MNPETKPARVREMSGATEATHVQNAFTGYAFDSTRGYPGEGPASAPTTQQEPVESIRGMALNMNGMGNLESRNMASTPEAGRTMAVIASTKISEVLQIIRTANVQFAALADIALDDDALADARQLFEEAGYECYGTPGSLNSTRVKRGAMIVWDPTTCELQNAVDTCTNTGTTTPTTVLRERIVKARLRLLQDGREVTIYAVYMPVRYGNPDAVIDEAWDALTEDVETELDADRNVLIGGDFNAETEAWRARRSANPGTHADDRMAELLEMTGLLPQAQDATYRTGSQIDNWLVSARIDACTRRADTLPGVSGKDHMAVVINYMADVEAEEGRLERPVNTVVTKLAKEMRQEPKDKRGELLAAFQKKATELWKSKEQREDADTDEPSKLRNLQEALMQAAATGQARGHTETDEQSGSDEATDDAPGDQTQQRRASNPKMPPREIARWRVAKWIRHLSEACRWSGGDLRTKWQNKGMWKVPRIHDDPTLCLEAADSRRTRGQRRQHLINLCEEMRLEAQTSFDETQAPTGDQLLERMEACTTQNMGSCMQELFTIIKEHTGKGARKPSKLMSMYPDDDAENPDLVRGPAVKTEVHKVATRINAKRTVHMATVRELLEWLHKFPADTERQQPIADRLCSHSQLRAAIRYAKPAKGLGIDGFDAYSLKWMPEEMFEAYHRIMHNIIQNRDFPHEWNNWIALLALKPDEDPKKLGRRRDLWLQCHNAKIMERLLMAEYDHASWQAVPASQAGFEKERNAPEQTLALRLKAEEAMMERKMLCRGYIDLGTFFMSCCHDVQAMVEQWSGVPHDTRQVMSALREGLEAKGMPSLTGRYETAYGLTEPIQIEQGLGQGSLLSPVRAKLMLSVIQYALQKLCPGSRMTMDGRRIIELWYADDGCICTDDLPSLQLAFECVWLTTKMLGLLWQVKHKKKTAWSATWWKDGKEIDVTGYEMRMPDTSLIPQLVGDETYKYLGTEMSTGWNNGKAHKYARAKVVRRCRQLIGLLGRVPCLTEQQFGTAVSLALSGCVGYYARSTVLTWEDCVKIEQSRVAALQAKGVTEGVPRRQIFGSTEHAEMGHEHVYTIATAALRDQIDRALCGREGEPARAVVEEAIAKTCYRLGCRGAHPLEWQPTHLTHELRDDLIIEAYLKGMIQCGWRGKLTQGGRQLHGPLGYEAEWEWTAEKEHGYGPRLWESRQQGEWDSRTATCSYSRALARKGITHWAHIMNATSGKWLTLREARAQYNIQPGRESSDYEQMITLLDGQSNQAQRDRWFRLVHQNQVYACTGALVDDNVPPTENREERLRNGYWELDKVLAARRTATCFGGYEYAVQWIGEQHEVNWIPQCDMRSDHNTRAAMTFAREHSLKASSYHEWLEMSRQTAKIRDSRDTCAGRTNKHGWRGVWRLFIQYRDSSEIREGHGHTRSVENHPETPAALGRRGRQWEPDAFHTCYLGETQKEKKMCSLHANPPIAPHLLINDNIITTREQAEWGHMRRRVAQCPNTPPLCRAQPSKQLRLTGSAALKVLLESLEHLQIPTQTTGC